MFEKELFEYIKNNFVNTLPELWQNVSIYFGEAPEETPAPYIVMYPLNTDGTRQVLCNTDNYTDGSSSIQFSVYDVDYSNAFYIGHQLDIFLADIYLLDTYRVLLNNTEVIRGFPSVNTGLSTETVTRLFTYTVYEQELFKVLTCKDGILIDLDDLRLTVY